MSSVGRSRRSPRPTPRAAAAKRALTEARAATDPERALAALRDLDTAALDGAGQAEARALFLEAQAAAARRAEDAALARLATDPEAGARAFCALTAASREAAAARADLPLASWLAALGPGEAAVEAALALHAWRAGGDRPTLEPHARLLRRLADGRAALEEEAVAARAAQARAVSILVAEASAALAAGDLDAAWQRSAALPAGERAILREAIERARAAAAQALRIDRARAAGDLPTAARLAAEAGDGALAAALEAELREAWRPCAIDDPDLDTADLQYIYGRPGPRAWLTEDGSLLALPTARDRWLFVRLVDPETLQVRRVLVARLPERRRVTCAEVRDGVITVLDDRGSLAALRLADAWPVRARTSPLSAADEGGAPDGVALTPDGRGLWVLLQHNSGPELRTYDLDNWPSWRRVERAGYPVPLYGHDTPAMAVLGDPGAPPLRTSGRASGGPTLPAGLAAQRAATDPRGHGLVTLSWGRRFRELLGRHQDRGETPPDPEEIEDAVLCYRHRDDPRGTCSAFELWWADMNQPLDLATSVAEGRTWAVGGGSERCQVASVSVDPDGGLVAEEERSWAPRTTFLVTDVHARRVRGVALSATGLSSLDVMRGCPGWDRARVMDAARWAASPLKGLTANLGCAKDGSGAIEAVRALGVALQGEDEARLRARMDEAVAQLPLDPSAVLDLEAALAAAHRRDLASELDSRLGALAGPHPRARMIRAGEAACSGHQPAVLAELSDLAPDDLPGPVARHMLHLRAVARLHHDDLDGARRDLAAAERLPGRCKLGGARALVAAWEGRPAGAADEPTREALRALVTAVATADRALAARDPEAAVCALQPAPLWRMWDVQSHARRATAWLALDDPERALRRHLALATYLDVFADLPDGLSASVPLPGATWDRAKLGEVAAAARAWLEEESPLGRR